jgi:carbamoyl-phosphate synthase small subunit
VFAAGLVVKDVPARASNFRSDASLGDYLRREKTVGIAGIDTRRLTRLLRSSGAQNGCIVALPAGRAITDAIVAGAVARARAAPSMAGLDLAKVVSVREPYEWAQTEWALGSGYGELAQPRFHVVAYDFGVKFNILRMLAGRGCRITVVPAQTPAAHALEHGPDGIFLANGPGDPEPCQYAVAATREFIERGIPTFGICLGHQIMALACGARTYKMKFGHHGATIRCRKSTPAGSASPARTTASRSTVQRCPGRCGPRTCRSSTARCRGWPTSTSRPSASRATRKPRPARTTSPTCSTASRR